MVLITNMTSKMAADFILYIRVFRYWSYPAANIYCDYNYMSVQSQSTITTLMAQGLERREVHIMFYLLVVAISFARTGQMISARATARGQIATIQK